MYSAAAFNYYYYCAFWCDVAWKVLNVYFLVHYGAVAANSNEQAAIMQGT